MKNTSNNLGLQQFRTSLDNLDQALVCLLAERFRVTHQVGLYKRHHNIAIQDKDREAQQLQRIRHIATEAGLNPEFAAKLLRLVIDETLKNHQKLREEQ